MREGLTSDVIAEKVIGCAFEVHMILGNGFRETTYQQALTMELKNAGLDIEEPVFKNHIPDQIRKQHSILIEGRVLVALNTKVADERIRSEMADNLRNQELESGILLNFGARNVTFKQIRL